MAETYSIARDRPRRAPKLPTRFVAHTGKDLIYETVQTVYDAEGKEGVVVKRTTITAANDEDEDNEARVVEVTTHVINDIESKLDAELGPDDVEPEEEDDEDPAIDEEDDDAVDNDEDEDADEDPDGDWEPSDEETDVEGDEDVSEDSLSSDECPEVMDPDDEEIAQSYIAVVASVTQPEHLPVVAAPLVVTAEPEAVPEAPQVAPVVAPEVVPVQECLDHASATVVPVPVQEGSDMKV